MRLAAVAVGLLSLLPAEAATVEVLVRERGAGPISHQQVTLALTPAPGEVVFWRPRPPMSDATGESGKVTFRSVPVGRYTVSLDTVGAGLINPAVNPLAPPPQITIAGDGDKVSLEVEVWRGTGLMSEVIIDRASVPRGARLTVRSLDGQPDAVLPLDPRGRAQPLLLPGRYELELTLPPGFLLVDVVWNGESLPGHVVRFDVREDTRPQNVSWYVSTPCLVTGRIAVAGGSCSVQIVATLVQPGPWIQAAQQRGGSSYQVVPNQEWDEHIPCLYRLWLPDGRWIVKPQGDFISAEPESADLTLTPGETRTLDFELTTKDEEGGKKGQPLTVAVASPDRNPVIGAIVEIWPPEGKGSTADPVATGKTEGFGSVQFRSLAAGSYLVAAGRPEYIEGTATVDEFDPKAPEARYVRVTLKEGAKLHAHAVDEKDHAVQGVELSYTRVPPLPKTAIANEQILAKKRQGSALTDVTGHTEVPGLYSGEYKLEARMTGELAATRFVVTKPDQVNLTEGERTDVELRVLPAASLSGGLTCTDRGTMPTRASFRIFPANAPIPGLWSDKDLKVGAVTAADHIVLRGTGVDRFHLGPFVPGEYRLAARPDGQRYWSWASNELVPDRATVFSVTDTTVTDAQVVEIECGPVVALVPEIKSKEPVPDLRLGTVRPSLRPLEKEGRGVDPDVEAHPDRVFLRRLREGKFNTAVTVQHPYLIPPSVKVPEQVLELTRGNMTEIHIAFERVGGMVEVRGEGKAARLTPETGDPVIAPLADGKVDFPGTIPGTYRVDLCADPACSSVTATWKGVSVAAGRTAFLP